MLAPWKVEEIGVEGAWGRNDRIREQTHRSRLVGRYSLIGDLPMR